jgi:hypothetical protein
MIVQAPGGEKKPRDFQFVQERIERMPTQINQITGHLPVTGLHMSGSAAREDWKRTRELPSTLK